MKEEYIKLIRERSYLIQTAYLYPSHIDEIKEINKK